MLSSFISFQENLQQWLTDEKARDQFVIRAGSDTEVLWNDARHLKPEPVYKRTVSRHHDSCLTFPVLIIRDFISYLLLLVSCVCTCIYGLYF